MGHTPRNHQIDCCPRIAARRRGLYLRSVVGGRRSFICKHNRIYPQIEQFRKAAPADVTIVRHVRQRRNIAHCRLVAGQKGQRPARDNQRGRVFPQDVLAERLPAHQPIILAAIVLRADQDGAQIITSFFRIHNQ